MVIAVVDDDWGMLELISYILRKKGHTVHAFADARECLESIANPDTACPDLLIADLMMPFFDGIEVAAHVRDTMRCSAIPIILISSADNIERRQELWDLFLHKPFSREQLLRAVDEVLERGRKPDEAGRHTP